MRWLALFPATVFAFAAAATQADETPKRKSGLWELRWYSNDVKPSRAAALIPDSAKMCIDDTTDEKLAAVFDPCDPPIDFAFYAPQFKRELVCETAAADVKATSRSTLPIISKCGPVSNQHPKARANIAAAAKANG
jgi:hypothetical protein